LKKDFRHGEHATVSLNGEGFNMFNETKRAREHAMKIVFRRFGGRRCEWGYIPN
jgi:hypothetical protein